ncbi:MAG: electron transfer flavoprotein subunit alpha/FixB family protein [Eubacteriales bacterium]|nr:electron transfer flavoprotein subunit alpha/FixB family protein [Eubacteriales bacterium]
MNIIVFCEQEPELGLLTKARELAEQSSGRMTALLENSVSVSIVERFGAAEAIVIERAVDDCAQADRIAAALDQLAPDAVLFPATVRGRFLSAWVAAKLETGLTADCTSLSIHSDGTLLQSRPAFGGNLTADILCQRRRPQMASVRPGVFPALETEKRAEFSTRSLTLAAGRERLSKIGFTPVEKGASLQTAKVVVAGGKGVGSKKGFELLFTLADLLGGAVGATRSAVDAGWIGYAHQVGQTGVAVRPRLYLAFGISGLVQHTVGMNGSGTVIAVNKDRNAPIFSCADYGVVDDWETVAVQMIRNLERMVSP